MLQHSTWRNGQETKLNMPVSIAEVVVCHREPIIDKAGGDWGVFPANHHEPNAGDLVHV